MAEFSERLKILRREAGLRQEDFAKEINVAKNTVSSWERGARKPDLPVMEMLAQWFHVSLGYLLGKTDERREVSSEDVFGYNCTLEDTAEITQDMAKRIAALCQESRKVLGATLNALYEMDRKANRLDLSSQYEITIVPQYASTVGVKDDVVGDRPSPDEDFEALDD